MVIELIMIIIHVMDPNDDHNLQININQLDLMTMIILPFALSTEDVEKAVMAAQQFEMIKEIHSRFAR